MFITLELTTRTEAVTVRPYLRRFWPRSELPDLLR